MKRKKYNLSFLYDTPGSIAIGILLGFLVGFFTIGLVSLTNVPLIVCSTLFGGAIFGWLAYKTPRIIEYLAYAICLIILTAGIWDIRVGRGDETTWMFVIYATLLFIINIFIGRVSFKGAKTTTKKHLGID